jgi:hypothetical protein
MSFPSDTKHKRVITSNHPDFSEALTLNTPTGANKTLQIGPKLLPFGNTGSFTTDVTTSTKIERGSLIAVYNNNSTVGSIVLSPTSVASLAAGVTDVNGNVGLPIPPNSWAYFTAWGDDEWIIASANTLKAYIVLDYSTVVKG